MEGDANEIQQKIEARINELPVDLQNAILASDFNEKILAIGNANSLHVDRIQELGDNTMLLMLGFMTEDEYRKEVSSLNGVNEAGAQKILADVNTKILLPIRDSMKKFAVGQAPQTPAEEPRPSLATQIPLNKPAAPVAPAPTPAPASVTPSAPKVEMHPADLMLTEQTVAALPAISPATPLPAVPTKPQEAKAVPPKPQDYKADPYREPVI